MLDFLGALAMWRSFPTASESASFVLRCVCSRRRPQPLAHVCGVWMSHVSLEFMCPFGWGCICMVSVRGARVTRFCSLGFGSGPTGVVGLWPLRLRMEEPSHTTHLHITIAYPIDRHKAEPAAPPELTAGVDDSLLCVWFTSCYPKLVRMQWDGRL